MKLFNVGKAFAAQHQNERESEKIQKEADGYKLASDGGFMTVLKSALFLLFGYYNARLFISTVPGWEGWLTAIFALGGEATAFYCLFNYTRSAGAHKTALGVFGVMLTVFSVTHATISFFKMEQGRLSSRIHFYAEFVAFPVLFGLLLIASIVIPLCHWRKRVAQEQAAAQVEIQSDRARLVAESAALKNQSALERERLAHLRERIKIGNEYTVELKSFAQMKQSERAALAEVSDPEVRKEIANALGLKIEEKPKPQNVIWRGNSKVDELGN
jgi:hypothetical protein